MEGNALVLLLTFISLIFFPTKNLITLSNQFLKMISFHQHLRDVQLPIFCYKVVFVAENVFFALLSLKIFFLITCLYVLW